MNSVSKDCQELKSLYDSCFNQWYSEKFLHGQTDDASCDPVYKQYQQCVKEALTKLKIEIPKFDDGSKEEKPSEEKAA